MKIRPCKHVTMATLSVDLISVAHCNGNRDHSCRGCQLIGRVNCSECVFYIDFVLKTESHNLKGKVR